MADRVEYEGRTFKSGNSVALRLPKGMGVPEGTEVRMVKEAPMTFRIEPKAMPKKKLDIDSVWAISPGHHVPEPREDFDERPSVMARRVSGEDA